MWLLDTFIRKPRWLIKISRTQVTLWQRLGRTWIHAVAEPCGGDGGAHHVALAKALNKLLAHQAAHSGTAQFVVDSCWLPAFALQVGAAPLARPELAALARLRLSNTYGESSGGWSIEIAHRPGDAFGLAYACPPALMDAINTAMTSNQMALAGVHPTLAWSLAHAPRQASRHSLSAINVLEEDRFITTFWQGKDLVGMHPNVQPAHPQHAPDEQQLELIARRCQANATAPLDARSTVHMAWWTPQLEHFKYQLKWNLMGRNEAGDS